MCGLISKHKAAEKRILPPYSMIISAVAGDAHGIEQVLAWYDRQLDFFSNYLKKEEDGSFSKEINEEIKDRLTARLIQAVMRFKIDYKK